MWAVRVCARGAKGKSDTPGASLQHWPWQLRASGHFPRVLHPFHVTEKLSGTQRGNTDITGTESL